jgi:transcription-repair coupling factor (superfamily II helicase)
MIDRFGPLSIEARNLVEVMRFRGLLRRFGVVTAERKAGRLALSFSARVDLKPKTVSNLPETSLGKIKLTSGGVLHIVVDDEVWLDPKVLFMQTEHLLSKIFSVSVTGDQRVQS